ncbi:MAG: cell wall metabolism sensor histidine kinase WalK, partial [Deltaproteobacteria bacterium]|nr:cell wall metabolism sensor histidine kinase WalK [Deltaproteobacteria bacterium]
MKISFNTRIFLLITIPYLLLTLILLLTIRAYSQKELSEIIYSEMRTKAEIIEEIYIASGEEKLKEYIEHLKKTFNINYRITVITNDGKVVLDSDRESFDMENHRDRPEFIKALEGSTGTSVRHSKTLNSDMAYLAIPVAKDNIITGAVRISLPLSDFMQKVNRLSSPILIYGLITIILFYILIYLVTSKMLRPIDEMIQVSEKIQRGNFSARLLLPPSKEYELLYNTFNNMLSEIQNLLVQNQKRTNELNSVISSINEGIILVGRDLNIILANRRFSEIAGTKEKDLSGKKLYEILRNSDLNNIIKKSFENQESFSDETEINADYYLISSSYDRANDIVVVLLYNITYIKKMQIYKKEFVSNASHELKTPLTAINGFIDTLNDEISDETHKRYLEIIKNQTDRLSTLIEDLLTLSRIESGEIKIEKEKIAIDDLVFSCLLYTS